MTKEEKKQSLKALDEMLRFFSESMDYSVFASNFGYFYVMADNAYHLVEGVRKVAETGNLVVTHKPLREEDVTSLSFEVTVNFMNDIW